MPPKVLVPLADGFEEIEAVTPIDILRRAGAEVKPAAVGDRLVVEGKTGIRLETEIRLADIKADNFDLLFLPGGPAAKSLRENQEIIDLVLSFESRKAWIAAICAAPTILHAAGTLENHRYTAHFSTKDTLVDSSPEEIVRDGNIITSQGAGTAVPFGLTLVEVLFDEKIAREVAESICYKG